jgi:hypothetical protein
MADMTKYVPECPFCGRSIERPVLRRMDFGQADAGDCPCGAVYVCDPTGRNEGEAFRDALVLAKGDWEIDQLAAGSDYEVSSMDYDMKSHIRIYNRSSVVHAGRLIFVRMIAKQPPVASAPMPDLSGKGAGREMTKKELIDLLDAGSIDEIGRRSVNDKNVMKFLIAVSYDKEDVRTWRAIEAMGSVARHARVDVVRETTRKLLWSMTDESGGIGWSAPEMLGEIVRANPAEYRDLIPLIWNCRDEDLFRPGATWGLYRAAQADKPGVASVVTDLDELMNDPNPAVRGYGLLLADAICHSDREKYAAQLTRDGAEFPLYDGGEIRRIGVKEVIEIIGDKAC